jgi:putative ABC transport system permease protein
LELRVEELVASGLPRADASAQARSEFGDVDQTVEYLADRAVRRDRRERHSERWSSLLRDLRISGRSFLRRPLVPLVVVVTLALGIGANTAVYSLVDALTFRPLPFGDGERLVRMRDATERPDGSVWPYNTSARSYNLLRDSGIFKDVTAQRYRLVHLTGEGPPVTATAIGVAPRWTETLQVPPILGRPLSPEEEAAGENARVVLLGHDLWQRRYGGDVAVLGRTVSVDDTPFTVVGVMPPRFNYPYGAELWIPDTFDPADAASGPNVAARLRDGETLASTQQALDALSARAEEVFPDTHRAIRFLAVPQRDDLLGNQPQLGWVLLAAVGFLLLIASANVANLLLVRSLGRRRERAVETALGASRLHLVRRLLAESVLLAVVGGGLGVGLAALLLDPMAALSVPANGSLGAFFTHLTLDGRVLGFAALITLGTTLVFGVVPAVLTFRDDPMEELRDGGRSVAGGWGLQAGLVMAEVAVAVVLLAGATLLLRDYSRLLAVNPGFETEDRMVVSLALPRPEAGTGEERLALLGEMRDHLLALPGVTDVSWANHLPVSDGSTTRAVTAENGPASGPESLVLANARWIGPRYLETMGMMIEEGRTPTEAEIRDRSPVVVLSRSAADHYWPGQDAVGRRVRFGLADDTSTWLTVVGVLSPVREEWELEDTWYLPAVGQALDRALLVLHSGAMNDNLAGEIRTTVWDVDPDQPIERIVGLSELVAETYTSERLATNVIGAFAAVGLLLAALGVYGVVTFSVNGSLKAMGIRLALGAGAARVQGLVIRKGGLVVGAGLVLGSAGAVVLTRFVARFFSGGGRRAIHTLSEGGTLGLSDYALVFGLLGFVTLLACYLPARRAARVDPVQVLRDE